MTPSSRSGSLPTLHERIAQWAHETHGWETGWVPCGNNTYHGDHNLNRHAFRCGPHTGYGRTTNEAINRCADGLIEDGWQDDRGDIDHEFFSGYWEPTDA